MEINAAQGQHHQQVVSAPLMTMPCNFSQLEESEAKCAEAQRSQQTAALELENLHTELETLSRNKTLVGSWRCDQGRWEGTVPPRGVWQQSAAAECLINHLGVLITPRRRFTKS